MTWPRLENGSEESEIASHNPRFHSLQSCWTRCFFGFIILHLYLYNFIYLHWLYWWKRFWLLYYHWLQYCEYWFQSAFQIDQPQGTQSIVYVSYPNPILKFVSQYNILFADRMLRRYCGKLCSNKVLRIPSWKSFWPFGRPNRLLPGKAGRELPQRGCLVNYYLILKSDENFNICVKHSRLQGYNFTMQMWFQYFEPGIVVVIPFRKPFVQTSVFWYPFDIRQQGHHGRHLADHLMIPGLLYVCVYIYIIYVYAHRDASRWGNSQKMV